MDRRAMMMLSLAACYLPSTSEAAQGYFSGRVITEWLPGEKDQMRLVEEFRFTDANGTSWHAPKGIKINGASIPRALWYIVGHPYEEPYRRASVIHDVYCDIHLKPWRDVHRMFYEAMLVGGTPLDKAKRMYLAVYACGPRWDQQSVDNTLDYIRHEQFCSHNSCSPLELRPEQNVPTPITDPAKFEALLRDLTDPSLSIEQLEKAIDAQS